MSLRLYDSAARQVRDFVPLVDGQVGIYVCGATPQARPHIGHLRSAVAFDVLRRWLVRTGHAVTLVRNVTDIDDKVLAEATTVGEPWWALAFRYELEFARAYDTVGVLRPSYEPRATGHVTEMVELVGRLVERGHAYPVAGGDVYFDVRSWPAYGELTRQRLDDLEPAADTDPDAAAHKRDPRDFALWKGSKPHEPPTASWPAPWGRGRPGWHLECSAMSTRYLGAQFDIHGGGLDLRFPHHENEQAQSRAAGDGFVRYWMHNAWVVVAGEKMSKSIGNYPGAERGAAAGPAGRGALPAHGAALPLQHRGGRGLAPGGQRGVPADRGLRAAGGGAARRVGRRRGSAELAAAEVPAGFAGRDGRRPGRPGGAGAGARGGSGGQPGARRLRRCGRAAATRSPSAR